MDKRRPPHARAGARMGIEFARERESGDGGACEVDFKAKWLAAGKVCVASRSARAGAEG